MDTDYICEYDHSKDLPDPPKPTEWSPVAQRWYVIDGEIMDKHGEPLGARVVRVDVAKSYEEMVDMLKRDYPSITCINADEFCAASSEVYGVPVVPKTCTYLTKAEMEE